MLHDLNSC